MILVANTVIDDWAVVVKSFNAFVTGHAMDWALGPNASAEKAKVVQIPLLTQSFVKVLVELCKLNRFCVPRIFAKSYEKHDYTQKEESNWLKYQDNPGDLLSHSFSFPIV